MNINIVKEKAERELQRVLDYGPLGTKEFPPSYSGVAVREKVDLSYGTPEDLYFALKRFLLETEFDKDSEMVYKAPYLYLEGTRRLTEDEKKEFTKGLFDE